MFLLLMVASEHKDARQLSLPGVCFKDSLKGTLQSGQTGLLALTLLILVNLAKQGVDAEINTFLEGVAHLFGVEVGTGEADVEGGLLVLGGLRLHDLEDELGLDDILTVLLELGSFFLNESMQLVSCIEVDGLNLEFHSNPPF